MGKVISAIGSKKDGSVEFMLAEAKNPTDFFIFYMPPEDAYRLSNKLREAADNAKRGVESYDVAGDRVPMNERLGKKRMASREKFKGCYGQESK